MPKRGGTARGHWASTPLASPSVNANDFSIYPPGSSSAHLGGAGFAWDAPRRCGIGGGRGWNFLPPLGELGGQLSAGCFSVAAERWLPRVCRSLEEDGCGKRRIPSKAARGMTRISARNACFGNPREARHLVGWRTRQRQVFPFRRYSAAMLGRIDRRPRRNSARVG